MQILLFSCGLRKLFPKPDIKQKLFRKSVWFRGVPFLGVQADAKEGFSDVLNCVGEGALPSLHIPRPEG